MAFESVGITQDKVEALRARYRAERDKRLRPDGNAQYITAALVNRDYDRDPHADPGFTREAVTEEVDAVFVGGGLGGVLGAVYLRKVGIENVRIVEMAADFGGTWYWNRYPGAACDVEAYCYLPLLEETGYVPTQRYVSAPEILEYIRLIGRQFDLYRRALFQTVVESAEWDEDKRRWIVTTDRGDRLSARFMVTACGVLHKPKLPRIPGADSFQGRMFHTSRWDYTYTGGSPTEPMTQLADKRVGIVGTGATGVQVIPALAEAAGHLHVFQRTPAAAAVRDNQPTDPDWVQSLKPGWQRERIDNLSLVGSGAPFEKNLVSDGFTAIYRDNQISISGPNGQSEELAELNDFRVMEEIRARIEAVVEDKATAEALKPWFHRMCKRPNFHDEYLPAFNRPNVSLVDTNGKGIDRITATGMVVAGVEYPLDCLIFASGFESDTSAARVRGFDPRGRGGVPLSEAWRDGPGTLHGLFTHGFPNWFMFGAGAQGAYSINYTHMVLVSAEHTSWLVRRCFDEGIEAIEPSREAQEQWFQFALSNLSSGPRFQRPDFQAECTPGYYNGEGKRDPSKIRSIPFNGGFMTFERILKDWRNAGDLSDLIVTRATQDHAAGTA